LGKGRQFDADWMGWLQTNVARGCSHEELRAILKREGFREGAIQRAFDEVLRSAPVVPAAPAAAAALAAPPKATLDIENLERFESGDIELYTAEDFIDPAHCADLIQLIKSALRPSTISAPPAGETDRMFRTSRTCDLVGNDRAIARLDAKLCAALGWDASLVEPSQGQCYEVGQEFKPHTDFFKPYELETYSTETWGQRTWTLMIYLNDVEGGGETRFVDVDLTIKPKRGMAVVWNNLLPSGEGNPKTRHTGMPVTAGTKFVITKWFRMPRNIAGTSFTSARYSWTQAAKA
jgi:prolyl 4-hydroxylase